MLMKIHPKLNPINASMPIWFAPQFIGQRGIVTRYIQLFNLWIERSRQRRSLAQMDDNQLKDVGISRAEVARETCKFFWQ